MIIRVAIDVPIPRLFDYLCDDASSEDIGRRVRIRFGRRQLVGIVVEVSDFSELPKDRLKYCDHIFRDQPALPGDWMSLGRFCSDYYQLPIGQTLLSVLPPRLRRAAPMPPPEKVFAITDAGKSALETLSSRHKKKREILQTLLNGPLEKSDLIRATKARETHIESCLTDKWLEVQSDSLPGKKFVANHELNFEQRNACDQLISVLGQFACFLLFGVTGSGKTEVYLNLIAEVLSRGKQALVLVPEIALTPTLESLFRERFPDSKLSIQHSNMGQTARANAWIDSSTGRSRIVLGTRLAVFSPMNRLGLIVVDEEQDSSYKQNEGLRYSARDLAIFRGRQVGAPVLLCSATPSLETLHHAKQGRYRLLRMTQRAHKSARLPTIHLVDTRRFEKDQGISMPLQLALEKRLQRNEQSVLFLNRRGYAPILVCSHCGWISRCSRCSVNLVVHLAIGNLKCHHCGFQSKIPNACPHCGNVDLTPFGRGTQRLESEVAEKFPNARIVRVDSDSSIGKLKEIIDRVKSGEADIVVGTQLLAKGHHFERVTLVGVLNADAGLFSSDYRAPERLFAQLQQVSGRAGRADLPGEVFIQTRFPDHPLYGALLRQDYEGYAHRLLDERRAAGFPPFVFEAALRAFDKTMVGAMSFLSLAISLVSEIPDAITIFDPAPASVPKLAGLERAQLVIQSRSRPALQSFIREWNALLCNRKSRVRWHFDVDPIEF